MTVIRELLKGVPQDSRFHPEGDAWDHIRAVRASVDDSLVVFRTSGLMKLFRASGPNLSKRDRNVLRVAAWCHDLGKAYTTTSIGGQWLAPDHEQPRHVNRALRQLGRLWRNIWDSSSFEDKKDLLALVTRHMLICDTCGLHPRILRALISSIKPLRNRAQLLVIFIIMDRMGCGHERRNEGVQLAIDAVLRTPASTRRAGVRCNNSRCWRKAVTREE